MEKIYRKKLIIGLLTLQLLFVLFFILALINNIHGRAILGTGLDYSVENYIVMIFSVLSMINIIYEIIKIR